MKKEKLLKLRDLKLLLIMDKKVLIMLIKNQQVKQEDFLQFIIDYCEYKKKPTPTAKQLPLMLQLFQQGIFSLKEPIEEMIKYFKLQVVRVFDKSGVIIRTDVYDN